MSLTMRQFVLKAFQQKEVAKLPEGPEQNRAVRIYAGKIKYDLDERMTYYYNTRRGLKDEGLILKEVGDKPFVPGKPVKVLKETEAEFLDNVNNPVQKKVNPEVQYGKLVQFAIEYKFTLKELHDFIGDLESISEQLGGLPKVKQDLLHLHNSLVSA